MDAQPDHLRQDIVGMPSIIFDILIQQLLDSRPPFHFTTLAIIPTELSEAECTLSAMALVHRSWTLRAQRALGTRLCIDGIRKLGCALRTPIFGRWTREVSFKWRWGNRDEIALYSYIYGGPSKEMKRRESGFGIKDHEYYRHNPDGEPPEDVISLLTTLFSRLGNIRLLRVWTYFAECEVSVFAQFTSALSGLADSLEGLWLAHDRGRLDSDNGCPYLRELCLILPTLVNLRHLSLFDWTAPTYTKDDEENRLAWHVVRKQTIPDRSHLGAPLPLLADTSPSPTLKSMFLKWECPNLPDEYAKWLFQPRGGYSLENVGLVVHLGTGPGRMNLTLVPTVSSCVGSVQQAFFDVGNWSPWRDKRNTPSLGGHIAPVACAKSARDLRLRLSGEFPSAEHARVSLHIPPTVEILYIKVTEYGDSEPKKSWLDQLDDYLYHVITENRLPSLRAFVLTHDVYSRKWGMRRKAYEDSNRGVLQSRSFDFETQKEVGRRSSKLGSDAGSSAIPGSYSGMRIAELCSSIGVRFHYTNEPDLYHEMVMV